MKNSLRAGVSKTDGTGRKGDRDDLLEEENRIMKEKLGLSDFCSYFGGEMDPRSLNQFLRQLIFMEDLGPQRTIRSLFPEKTVFPPAEELSEKELIAAIEAIEELLEGNGILVELPPEVPPARKYRYIVEELLPESVPAEIPESGAVHFTGCTGWCEKCFQKEYCDAWKEAELSNFEKSG